MIMLDFCAKTFYRKAGCFMTDENSFLDRLILEEKILQEKLMCIHEVLNLYKPKSNDDHVVTSSTVDEDNNPILLKKE